MLTRTHFLAALLILAACAQSDDEEGSTPSDPPSTPPPSTQSNAAPVISTATISGQEGVLLDGQIVASDDDGDPISFTLVEGPTWLNVSQTGAVSGRPLSPDVGALSIRVEASDGADTSEAKITIEIAYDPVEEALRTGSLALIEQETQRTAAQTLLAYIRDTRERHNADIAEIFQLDANGAANSNSLTEVSWNLDRNALRFLREFGASTPFLTMPINPAAPDETPHVYGLLGRKDRARFVILGDNPMRAAQEAPDGINDQMQQAMKNTLAWLIDADPSTGANLVLANLIGATNYPDETTTRDWLDAAFGGAISYNPAGECDGPQLAQCLSEDTDLLILSDDLLTEAEGVETSNIVADAVTRGVPVLYFHSGLNIDPFGGQIFQLFDVLPAGSNRRDRHVIENYSPIGTTYDWQPEDVSTIERVVSQIEDGALDYDFSVCQQYWHCPENSELFDEITNPLRDLGNFVQSMDSTKVTHFPASPKQRWMSLTILTADSYRAQTEFPMLKNATPADTLVRAMFGDIFAVIHRTSNLVGELGTYSRNDFSDRLLSNQTVELNSQRPYRTSGVYAIPGETVTVTRTDASDVRVALRVSSVRPNANAPFRNDYDRPILLRSANLPIEPGETLEFTSAYGGPVHVTFSADGEDVALEFQNVGQHPVWRGPEDTAEFERKLALDEFDWAEFVTPYFEIHSTLSKMRVTLSRPNSQTPTALRDAMNTYFRDWPHWLGGREGPGISSNPDLRAFADANGLSIPVASNVKHMNADRASCTASAPNCSGTSGNPYDALWSYNPISLGDLHELGHGLNIALGTISRAVTASIQRPICTPSIRNIATTWILDQPPSNAGTSSTKTCTTRSKPADFAPIRRSI